MHPEDFLTLEEWHRLLATTTTSREAALLCVSEVAALKVEHLDGSGGYLHVVNGKGVYSPTQF
jgi:integrase